MKQPIVVLQSLVETGSGYKSMTAFDYAPEGVNNNTTWEVLS